MKTFSTFAELFEATSGHQLTAQQVINRRAFVCGEWRDFNISEELNSAIISGIIDILGGRHATRERIRRTLRNGTPQHWGLGRIFLESYGGETPRFRYCAGQDYPSELAEIRRKLA